LRAQRKAGQLLAKLPKQNGARGVGKKVESTERPTPAMAAGVTKRLWEIGDIVAVLEAWEAA